MVEHPFQRIHSFRDPIHGFIRVNNGERAIVDSPVFQRLRRIHQLGTGYLVYHGAEHSRFGHSIGVLEVATKVFEAIRRRKPNLLASPDEWSRYEQILRLAALLHDIGHAPFSHASDDLFRREPDTNRRFRHEDYTTALVRESEIAAIINDSFTALGITNEDVIRVQSGEPSDLGSVGVLLQDIVAGELDADRMDYLARDSMYAGVSYGKYDLERLLDTVTAVEDENEVLHLAVDEGGLFALEEFLLARYYMFLQVYLNKQRRFYDQALGRVVKKLLADSEEFYPSPTAWKYFLAMDDIWLISRLPELTADGNQWARSLYERRHWPVIQSINTGDASQDQIRWTNTQRDVCDEFGYEVVLLDDARGKSFQRTEPGPYITTQAEPEERPKILVLADDGNCFRVEQCSDMVDDLGRRRIRIMRLYARPDQLDSVRLSWENSYTKHA